MPSPDESRRVLTLIQAAAVDAGGRILRGSSGAAEARRLLLLDTVPELVNYYADGSAALAADAYEDAREAARIVDSFTVVPVVEDRTVRIRRGVAWASDPLFFDDEAAAYGRLAEVISLESVRPYRDTILANRRSDPKCIGWRRVTSATGCKFCRFLADRGAVYREETARFAAHPNCSCTAAPVFVGGSVGPEASALQYIASQRKRTPAERERLRDWLNAFD